MRTTLLLLALVLACSHRDAPGASHDTVAPSSGSPTHTAGGRMQDVDDLDTDNVQGIARKYRAQGLAVVDRVVAAMRSDARPRVRANAATVLLDIFYFSGQKEKARPYLLEALGDPSPDVLSRAADGLAGWFLDDPAVKAALATHTETLRAATSSSDPIVQAHAVSALEKMGERPPAESLLRASSSAIRRRGIAQALAAHDLTAVPALVDLARGDPEPVVRMEAIPVAAELAAPDVRDSLLGDLVADPGDGVANAAIKAAGDTQAAALAAKLEAIVAAPGANRTAAAIAALAALGDTAAVPMIAAHLDDRSTDTKWNAKLALDALAAPARGLPEWQDWARQKGYLPANETKQ
jgi:HEAT repeat protein